MSSIMVPWHKHVANGAIHKVRTQGGGEVGSKQECRSIVLVKSFFFLNAYKRGGGEVKHLTYLSACNCPEFMKVLATEFL